MRGVGFAALAVCGTLALGGGGWAQEAQRAGAQAQSPTQISTSATPQPTIPAAATPSTPDFVLALNFGGSSDYVFRGVIQTNGNLQSFFGADATYEVLCAGFWTFNVDFKPFGDSSTRGEIDLSRGRGLSSSCSEERRA